MKKITNNRNRISSLMAILLTFFGLTSQRSYSNCLQLRVDSTKFSKTAGTFTFFVSAGKCKYDDFTLGDGKLKISMSGKVNAIDTAYTAGSFASNGYKVTGMTFSNGKLTVTYKEGGTAVTMKSTLKAFMVITMKVDTGTTTISWPDQKASDFERYKSSNKVDCLCSIPTYKDGPLPVTWYKLNASSGDGIVLVEWSTATEINNWKFEVERTDGEREWIKIGEVLGSGNSSQIKKYSLIDNNPLPGKSYYRVKQIDRDGRTDYSPIFVVNGNAPETGLTIYPNPASQENQIVLSAYGFSTREYNHSVTIQDAVGRMVFQSIFNGPGNILTVNLSPGMYRVTATGKDDMNRDVHVRQKLMVQ